MWEELPLNQELTSWPFCSLSSPSNIWCPLHQWAALAPPSSIHSFNILAPFVQSIRQTCLSDDIIFEEFHPAGTPLSIPDEVSLFRIPKMLLFDSVHIPATIYSHRLPIPHQWWTPHHRSLSIHCKLERKVPPLYWHRVCLCWVWRPHLRGICQSRLRPLYSVQIPQRQRAIKLKYHHRQGQPSLLWGGCHIPTREIRFHPQPEKRKTSSIEQGSGKVNTIGSFEPFVLEVTWLCEQVWQQLDMIKWPQQ